MNTVIDQIRMALDELGDAYQRGDAAAIDAASARLEELGQLALVVDTVPEIKRAAIADLDAVAHGDLGDPGFYLRVQRVGRDWTSADIASALDLPVRVVEAVRARIRQTLDEADAAVAREEDRRERERRDRRLAERRAACAHPCPTCGAASGAPCVARNTGRPLTDKAVHAARFRAGGSPG